MAALEVCRSTDSTVKQAGTCRTVLSERAGSFTMRPMTYRIESIELFVREMPPDRMSFAIGKTDDSGKTAAAKKRRPRAILLTRLTLAAEDGRKVIGCSGDRPSFGWLDKRPDRSPSEKLDLLLDLVEAGRKVYLECGQGFETPFALWLDAEPRVRALAKERDAEDLMASYASAMFERAALDAFCRIEDLSFHEAVKGERLGIKPGLIHPQLDGQKVGSLVPEYSRNVFAIRHTIGLSDPIDDTEWPAEKRVNDGEPETLAEYAKRDGLRFFKIKIAGDADADLKRLAAIWNRVLAKVEEVSITLDGNEAYSDLKSFAEFVDRFEEEIPGMFDHTMFIEQPLTRALTLDPSSIPWVRRIGKKKPLVIDEADGTSDAFRKAFAIGYSGSSHKNCKGVFKSLVNWALCVHFEKTTGREAFLTGEDLSNMPLIPLHQDFAVLGVLDIEHCERNGHHYAFGLSHLTETEKAEVESKHNDIYTKRGDEWFLDIEEGAIGTYSLNSAGLGGGAVPEWEKLTVLKEWREREGV